MNEVKNTIETGVDEVTGIESVMETPANEVAEAPAEEVSSEVEETIEAEAEVAPEAIPEVETANGEVVGEQEVEVV